MSTKRSALTRAYGWYLGSPFGANGASTSYSVPTIPANNAVDGPPPRFIT